MKVMGDGGRSYTLEPPGGLLKSRDRLGEIVDHLQYTRILMHSAFLSCYKTERSERREPRARYGTSEIAM